METGDWIVVVGRLLRNAVGNLHFLRRLSGGKRVTLAFTIVPKQVINSLPGYCPVQSGCMLRITRQTDERVRKVTGNGTKSILQSSIGVL